MPLAVLLLLRLFPVSRTVAYTILIASACPSAASGTAFTLRYQKDYRYASELYAFTTILSLITIPLITYVAELVLPAV